MSVLLVVAGLALLIAGGEALVRGASGIGLLARVSPAIVGLTIVAAGTSMPELVVSVQAALAGSPGIATGNVVGSNLFNACAILGVAALIRPLSVQRDSIRIEWPAMMAATLVMGAMIANLLVRRIEGAALVVSLVLLTTWLVRRARAEDPGDASSLVTASFGQRGGVAVVLNLCAVGLGVLLLGAGSTMLVRGASVIAASFGVSDTVIGLTIVAAGTSTPELVTSVVAAWRGRDEIAVANVLGSNLFNILGILGVTALIHPVEVPPEILRRDLAWLVGTGLLLFPLLRSDARIDRREGALLLVAWAVWLGWIVAQSVRGTAGL